MSLLRCSLVIFGQPNQCSAVSKALVSKKDSVYRELLKLVSADRVR